MMSVQIVATFDAVAAGPKCLNPTRRHNLHHEEGLFPLTNHCFLVDEVSVLDSPWVLSSDSSTVAVA
jgi:hypothetical protein